MSAIETSWLIGSVTLEDPQTIVVDGVNDAVIAAGTYYLRDATASLSLIDVILAAVAPFMTDEAIFVAESRLLRVTASVAFTWTIPSDLQAALGFGASIASTTSATASAPSNLLWSPGWCATTTGHPTGTAGWEVPQFAQSASLSSLTVRTVVRGTPAVLTELSWLFVVQDRVWTTDNGEPGEFRRWHRDVFAPGLRWKLYNELTEDLASSAAVTWPTALGPYVVMDPEWKWYRRSIRAADTFADIEIKAQKTSEL